MKKGREKGRKKTKISKCREIKRIRKARTEEEDYTKENKKITTKNEGKGSERKRKKLEQK